MLPLVRLRQLDQVRSHYELLAVHQTAADEIQERISARQQQLPLLVLKVPPQRIGIAYDRQWNLALHEHRISVSSGQRSLLGSGPPDAPRSFQDPPVGVDRKSVFCKAFAAIVRLTREDHGLAGKCELQSGRAVDGHSTIQKIERSEERRVGKGCRS